MTQMVLDQNLLDLNLSKNENNIYRFSKKLHDNKNDSIFSVLTWLSLSCYYEINIHDIFITSDLYSEFMGGMYATILRLQKFVISPFLFSVDLYANLYIHIYVICDHIYHIFLINFKDSACFYSII